MSSNANFICVPQSFSDIEVAQERDSDSLPITASSAASSASDLERIAEPRLAHDASMSSPVLRGRAASAAAESGGLAIVRDGLALLAEGCIAANNVERNGRRCC
jgi:hypothetical protein